MILQQISILLSLAAILLLCLAVGRVRLFPGRVVRRLSLPTYSVEVDGTVTTQSLTHNHSCPSLGDTEPPANHFCESVAVESTEHAGRYIITAVYKPIPSADPRFCRGLSILGTSAGNDHAGAPPRAF